MGVQQERQAVEHVNEVDRTEDSKASECKYIYMKVQTPDTMEVRPYVLITCPSYELSTNQATKWVDCAIMIPYGKCQNNLVISQMISLHVYVAVSL